ncbi:hypothetical protein FHR83_007813 [Actinoplanes campanulatus]|uniref:DUF4233 domain-containing protein n=1 Tax=Actinoplanes campanulatus TaxID=113559 RepID=A0A7W5APR1_9ACTN|nr:DUF4233 domain-containing protein [Actinoplanes campanulatus]MBB3100093.1 hypothetical protein [Actinoplanes campanulatus]GGN28192.1 hypothetical protein GCM10010109_46270 [Actinoplanes campanulatus]GID39095.1 hypothetical protein Aca09nite_56010 [Actinoplanes campanulatus]
MSAPQEPRPSGLKNPQAAVRGLGAGTLALETVVLLLMVAPLKTIAGDGSGPAIIMVLVLAVLAIVLAGSMKRSWAWAGGTALQVLLLLGGFLHWTLAAVGVIFGLTWVYVLHVRRTILG